MLDRIEVIVIGGMGWEKLVKNCALSFWQGGPSLIRVWEHSSQNITLSLKNALKCSGRAIILIVYYYPARYCFVLLYAVYCVENITSCPVIHSGYYYILSNEL
ncbi:hypothetical protein OIU84_004837 [Salix udensis]|uniref:Uncharacterized protein n=1 Tax=Salix udensis TaxID=889485 RepID=A0AAD6P4U5_9ROSI|nr:hypothetical protein OIU84_004837 [Salix udensis]